MSTSPLPAHGPNADQIAYWNEVAGPEWVQQQARLDRQIAHLGDLAHERASIETGHHVLDVGCGCGQTSLRLGAAVGAAGHVLGADVSAPMLEVARKRAAAEGLAQVEFIQADGQTHAFGAARFDRIYSRFGVMFFADPFAAFRNLVSALRPGGSVTFVCWQSLALNPWMRVPMAAAKPHLPELVPSPPDAPGPFAFADSERVRSMLTAAGLETVAIEDRRSDISLGGGEPLDDIVDLVLGRGPLGAALRGQTALVRESVRDAVLTALRPYESDKGVHLPAAVWLVTAR